MIRFWDKFSQRRILFGGVTLIAFLCAFFWFSNVQAATRTWDGGGGDGLWSTCANWSSDACPTSVDIAAFDGSNTTNATIDASFTGTVLGVSIGSGYTGTITQSRSLTVTTSGFSQAGGTYNQGNYDISTNRNFSYTGGSYSTGSGVVSFTGGSPSDTTVFTCTGTFPGTVNLAKTGSSHPSFTLVAGCEITTVSNESSGGSFIVNGTVNFPGTSLALYRMTVNNGATASGTSLTSASFTDGTFGGSLTLNSGGTFNTPATSITIDGNFTLDPGATFDPTGRTFTFNGGGTADTTVFTCTGTFPGTVNLAKTGSSHPSFTLVAGCEITTVSNESSGGALIINGTINFPGTSLSLHRMTVNSGATANATSTTSMSFGDGTFAGNLVLNNGSTFNTPATSFTLSGDFTLGSSASFDATGRTFTFNGGGTGENSVFTCTGTFPGTINLAKAGSGHPSFTIASGCSITTVSNESSGGSVIVNGTITFPGTSLSLYRLTINSGGVVNATSVTSPSFSDGTFAGSLTINNGSTFDIPATTFTINGNFTIGSSASFDATGRTFTFNGGGNAHDSTFACTGTFPGTVAIAKTGSGASFALSSGCEISIGSNNTTSGPTTINGTLNLLGYNFNDSQTFTISSTGRLKLYGSQTVTSPTRSTGSIVEYNGSGTYTTLPITGTYSNILFSSGTYNLTSSFTVADDFSNTGAIFNQTSGTVTFTGSANTITGDNTFYNLTKAVASPSTLTLAAGDTQTINGTLTLTGTDGSNRLSLESDTPDSQWYISPESTRTINFISVTDGNNTSGTDIVCYGSVDCVDGGNNTHFAFTPPPPPDPKVQLQGGVRLLGGVRLH